MTPYEKLHGSLYDISLLSVFGCLCYSNIITSHRKNLDNRSVSGIFLGLQPHTKGYLFLILEIIELRSQDILFFMKIFFHTN